MKLRIKLPLKREPYSGSTCSWVSDADGNDIARCSCGMCSCGKPMSGNVAFNDATAELIVKAVNATTNEEILKEADQALNDPKVLWNILTREIKILGPWREAKGTNWSISNGWRRFSPSGVDDIKASSVTVYSHGKPQEPCKTRFYEWGGIDWVAYNKAIEAWKIECTKWKTWKYTFNIRGTKIPPGYADTKEEAQQIVDSTLTDLDYLLYDGEEC